MPGARRRILHTGGLAVAACLVLLGAVPAALAAPVRDVAALPATGVIRASGAAAEVAVSITCAHTEEVSAVVALQEAGRDGSLIAGLGATTVRCSAGSHDIAVALAPLALSVVHPFRTGTTAAQLSVSCARATGTCQFAPSERIVTLSGSGDLDQASASADFDPALTAHLDYAGQRLAGGTSARLRAQVSCPSTASIDGEATLYQRRSDGSVVAAAASADIVCDGTPHDTVLDFSQAGVTFGTKAGFVMFTVSDCAAPPTPSGECPAAMLWRQVFVS